MDFKDNFSAHAAIYARYRPVYPKELFAYLSSLTAAHDLAWDCGTGNGQCAVQLADHYRSVYASDPSAQQIANAIPHPAVFYKVEKAEEPQLEDHSLDLITVAQALHWFDHKRFYREVQRVLRPGGILAVIWYLNPKVSAAIDTVTNYLHDVILKDYWLPENRMVEAGYQTLPFPFREITTPAFKIEKQLTLEAFTGHLKTWSALQRFTNQHQADPLAAIEKELKALWADEEARTVTWDLMLKVGAPL